MFRFLTAAVAAIFVVLQVYGDESRRPEVSRQVQDDVTGFSLASFALPETRRAGPALISGISEAQAVALALEAGKAHRTNRSAKPLRGFAAAAVVEARPALETADAPGAAVWYVTGERVNLRSGPGTGNPVVGQMVYGDTAGVISDRDGWYEIRTTDGNTSGWIYGRFLKSQLPG